LRNQEIQTRGLTQESKYKQKYKNSETLFFKSLINNFKNLIVFVAWKLSLILTIFFIASVARNPQVAFLKKPQMKIRIFIERSQIILLS